MHSVSEVLHEGQWPGCHLGTPVSLELTDSQTIADPPIKKGRSEVCIGLLCE